MDDLISRTALIEEYEWLKSQVNASSVPEIEEHIKRVNNAPAVDAVEVVRCKDCKFRKSAFNGEDYFCTVWDADESETAYVTETDFCSYGERRNGDG